MTCPWCAKGILTQFQDLETEHQDMGYRCSNPECRAIMDGYEIACFQKGSPR
jgi:hypothetical protein